jgi:predicted dehydrogenase
MVTGKMLRAGRRETNFVVWTGIHAIDAIFSFFGSPRSVATDLIAGSPACSSFAARFEFANGSYGHLLISPNCGKEEETYEVMGEGYCIKIDIIQCSLQIFQRAKLILDWSAPLDTARLSKDGTIEETAAFLEGLANGHAFKPTLEHGYVCMRAAELIQAGKSGNIDLEKKKEVE